MKLIKEPLNPLKGTLRATKFEAFEHFTNKFKNHNK
jgi:hypothetical protein